MSGGSGAERFRSPLRYPGGKGKIANYLKLLILSNDLPGCDYIEPYAGGAGAALALLFEEYVDRIHINDLDPGVYAFWRAVLDEPQELIERIRRVDVTMDEWHQQRALQASRDTTQHDLAFSTFFLNRTNRSGIITGGPIGGVRQSGKWRLDARFNKPDLIQRIERIARFRNRIQATNLDALHLLTGYEADRSGSHRLLYADPPYYVRGAELYRNSYGPSDHASVATALQAITSPWVVSYDNVDDVLSLYQGCDRIEYSLSYSAATRHRGSEVMFVRRGLRLPQVESPANIPLAYISSVRTA
ncbi:MAG: DNA adenine methylase [Acidimicrobiia bacterium]